MLALWRQVPSARQSLHELHAIAAVLPLLASSAEEVQEAGAMAIQQISLLPKAAREIRRQGGIPLLIELMSSLDARVQYCAVSATMNVAISDPKAAAAIRKPRPPTLLPSLDKSLLAVPAGAKVQVLSE
ncbi:MAG: armadillo/beta-catenin-like repeat-containing protein, partial [Pseudomonadota bacterium]|nr:armadillo/beta-catenin-like repeat-containing protein [Pseudomonadota bacterium]